MNLLLILVFCLLTQLKLFSMDDAISCIFIHENTKTQLTCDPQTSQQKSNDLRTTLKQIANRPGNTLTEYQTTYGTLFMLQTSSNKVATEIYNELDSYKTIATFNLHTAKACLDIIQNQKNSLKTSDQKLNNQPSEQSIDITPGIPYEPHRHSLSNTIARRCGSICVFAIIGVWIYFVTHPV